MALKRRSAAVRSKDNRILTAPFEFGLSLLFIITALNLAHQLITIPQPWPHIGLAIYPFWLLWTWAGTVLGGGVSIATGLLIGPYLRVGRGIEKAGVWLAATSWLTIAMADFVSDPHDIYGWLTYAAIVLSCALRLVALHKIERALAVAQTVSEENEDVEG